MPRPGRVCNRIPDDVRERVVHLALEALERSPRKLSVRFTDSENDCVSGSSVYRLLKATEEFKDKTVTPNPLWQTGFTYLKVIGWGWFYVSTLLDEDSRYIIAWKRCTTMKAEDVTADVGVGVGDWRWRSRPRAAIGRRSFISPGCCATTGPSQVAGYWADWLEDRDREHVRGAPYHPQTQGTIERWHQTLKNRVQLENYWPNCFDDGQNVTPAASRCMLTSRG